MKTLSIDCLKEFNYWNAKLQEQATLLLKYSGVICGTDYDHISFACLTSDERYLKFHLWKQNVPEVNWRYVGYKELPVKYFFDPEKWIKEYEEKKAAERAKRKEAERLAKERIKEEEKEKARKRNGMKKNADIERAMKIIRRYPDFFKVGLSEQEQTSN